MELAEVAYASDATLAKVAQRATKRQPAIIGPWANVKTGVTFLIDGKRFRATAIDPTRKGGDYAWVTGAWVTSAGRPVRGMISHLHCPEGQRSEFVNINDVEVFV